MSGTSAGWTKERRAAHSAFMVVLNRDPDFIAKRRKGQARTAEQIAAQSALMKRLNADPAFRKRQLASIATRAPRAMLAVPKHTHPIVRGLFVEMNEQRATRERVAKPAGLSKYSLSSWRTRSMPMLDAVDAALNTLDLELAIVPIGTRDENGFIQKKTGKK